jgi:hypothetical protein
MMLSAGFFAAGFWMVYLALEPYFRRHSPRALISWTRILSGRLRDPVVGADILIGITVGVTSALVINLVTSQTGMDSLFLPSSRMLSGVRGAFANTLGDMWNAVIRGLVLLFFAFLFRGSRTQWLAVAAVVATAFVFDVPRSPLPPAVAMLLVVPVAAAFVYLLLRRGLLAAMLAVYSALTLLDLPLTADFSSPATGTSVFVLCTMAALAGFGFHSTLTGRPLFKV